MSALLGLAARYGRWCLVLGLIAGLGWPALATTLRPALPVMIAGLLFLAALRIGPRAAVGGLSDLRRTLIIVLLVQGGAPLLALAGFSALGVSGAPLAVAVVLVLAAPSVTGSPNFTILLGHDPSAAIRLLLVGTALFPLTVWPVLYLAPGLGTALEVALGALRLLMVIAGAVGLAFAMRHRLGRELSPGLRDALDGASAILLGVVVIGLMSAVGPAMTQTPVLFAQWLLAACLINFGLQMSASMLCRKLGPPQDRVATSIVAGNRNIALVLVALPAATMDPLLLFIGCYQVPMYLTPILLRRLYGQGSG